ncbi:hypothetical protein [Peribacillus sp. SCS-155]|uniref:hypothetical protein n=1 Tax=Peribacillus sedimenti TaxID=3115297 RepID=UPI0039057C41
MAYSVKNLQESIKKVDREILADETKRLLVEDGLIKKNYKIAEIQRRIDSFLNQDTKYTDGFLRAFDSIYPPDGARRALLGKHDEKSELTWREIFVNATVDVPSRTLVASKDIEVITELKRAFITLVDSCFEDSREETLNNLRTITKILGEK